MVIVESFLGAVRSLWDTCYAALGGVAEVATLCVAVVVLCAAIVLFKQTKSFVLDLTATAFIAASTYIGLNAIYVVRDMEHGPLISAVVSIILAVRYLVQSWRDGNTKLKVIDAVLIIVLVLAGGFQISSLSPDSRVGELASRHLASVGDFWSGVFDDADAQLGG